MNDIPIFIENRALYASLLAHMHSEQVLADDSNNSSSNISNSNNRRVGWRAEVQAVLAEQVEQLEDWKLDVPNIHVVG